MTPRATSIITARPTTTSFVLSNSDIQKHCFITEQHNTSNDEDTHDGMREERGGAYRSMLPNFANVISCPPNFSLNKLRTQSMNRRTVSQRSRNDRGRDELTI